MMVCVICVCVSVAAKKDRERDNLASVSFLYVESNESNGAYNFITL